MPIVVGIRFENTPKVYWFAAGELEYTPGCAVIVETSRGVELGKVRIMPKEIPEEKVIAPLKEVVRIATEEDIRTYNNYKSKREDVMRTAAEKIASRGLAMKLVDVEYTLDGTKLVFYFTAETRVDFRELVRDLASIFKTRIELRQIGSRDECRMTGGLGPCGRICCCASGCDFAKVSVKMAKTQGLSLNPSKISGLCGRLMCCLSYENEHYAETNKLMPKVGTAVQITTDDYEGTGTAVGINQIKRTVSVRIELKDGSFETKDVPLDNIRKLDNASAADDLEGDVSDTEELSEKL